MLIGNEWANGLFGPFGGVVMLIFWIGIMFAAITVVRWLLTRSSAAVDPNRETAHEMVERRYADGEIDHDTYQVMMSQLGEPQQ